MSDFRAPRQLTITVHVEGYRCDGRGCTREVLTYVHISPHLTVEQLKELGYEKSAADRWSNLYTPTQADDTIRESLVFCPDCAATLLDVLKQQRGER